MESEIVWTKENWHYHKAQLVKNLPVMQEIRIRFLGRKDPLEKKMQPTPVFLPGKSHGQRRLVGYSPWGSKSQTQLSK